MKQKNDVWAIWLVVSKLGEFIISRGNKTIDKSFAYQLLLLSRKIIILYKK